MIRTDGTPTIAWAPSSPEVISNRDPGDEHHDPPQRSVVERIREWTVEGTDSGNGTNTEGVA